jgi:hypothetical protein
VVHRQHARYALRRAGFIWLVAGFVRAYDIWRVAARTARAHFATTQICCAGGDSHAGIRHVVRLTPVVETRSPAPRCTTCTVYALARSSRFCRTPRVAHLRSPLRTCLVCMPHFLVVPSRSWFFAFVATLPTVSLIFLRYHSLLPPSFSFTHLTICCTRAAHCVAASRDLRFFINIILYCANNISLFPHLGLAPLHRCASLLTHKAFALFARSRSAYTSRVAYHCCGMRAGPRVAHLATRRSVSTLFGLCAAG